MSSAIIKNAIRSRRDKIECIIFIIILLALLIPSFLPPRDRSIPIPSEQDLIARKFLAAAQQGDTQLQMQLYQKDLPSNWVTPAAMAAVNTQIKEFGSFDKIIPAWHVELKGNLFGKAVQRFSQFVYAIRSSNGTVLRATFQVNLETSPISIVKFNIHQMGSETELKALERFAGWPQTVALFFSIPALVFIWLTIRRVLKSSLSHRWLWLLLLFVNALPWQVNIGTGEHRLLPIIKTTLPIQVEHLLSFFPYEISVYLPLGAVFLFFWAKRRRVAVAVPSDAPNENISSL